MNDRYKVQDGGNHWYFIDRYGCTHRFPKADYDYDQVIGFADGEFAYDYDRH